MTENTRIDRDINSPPQEHSLLNADAVDGPVAHTDFGCMTETSGFGQSRRDFLAPGTLAGPGPIGRIARVLLGLASLSFVYSVIVHRDLFLQTTVTLTFGWLFAFAFGLWLVSPVVNVGLSRSWGYRPLYIVLILIGAATAMDLVLYGTIWAAPLGVVLIAWSVPLYTYLGGSFLLAAVLGTPGCEMRAVPDLVGRLSGRPHVEHACPGPLHDLDVWEQSQRDGLERRDRG